MLRNTILISPDPETVEEPSFQSSYISEASEETLELPIDLIQTTGHLVLRCPIVGAGIHDVEISLNTDTLTITKRADLEDPEKIVHWFNQECMWGDLSRTIELPKSVDPDHTRASLHNGVLTITMPIASKLNTRIIRIKE